MPILVTSLGGAVVGQVDSPTLAILENGYRGRMPYLNSLRPSYRIVRERWLDGVFAAEPLPDFKPHAVYAQVRDLRDPGSYFYGAVAAADMTQDRDDFWKVIPEDWTPSAGGG